MKGYPSLFIVFHPRVVRSPTSSFDVLKKETWVRVTVFGIFVDLSGFVCSHCSSNWCVRAFYICHQQCDFVTPILFSYFARLVLDPYICGLYFIFFVHCCYGFPRNKKTYDVNRP